MTDSKLSQQTRLMHPEDSVPEGFRSFATAVERASTVIFPDLATLRAIDWRKEGQWRYGLHATPTSLALAQRLAALEGGRHALLQPSGLAAIGNVYFGLVKAGDDVLIPDNIYGPTADCGHWLAQDFGISARFYDPMIGADIKHLLRPETRLVWLEAPGSVTMEVPDVRAITSVVRAHGAYSALDNTYSAGLAFKPFEHGVDVSVQALTKYQSGGSDVLMGATIVADEAVHAKLKRVRMLLGTGVSADDCSLVLRSLPSLRARFDAHSVSALALAKWLKTRPEIAKVLHPQLPDCPGHETFMRDFGGAGGLFSVMFDARYTPEQIDRFVEALDLFAIGWSWGGAHSLAMPYDLRTMRRDWREPGTLVRFYIGLEEEGDLRADIERSLAATLA
jgi:cysteine-S-conjugate beta-lyase